MRDDLDNIEENLSNQNDDEPSTSSFLKIRSIKSLDSSNIKIDFDSSKEPEKDTPLKIEKPKEFNTKKHTDIPRPKEEKSKSNSILAIIIFILIFVILILVYFIYINFSNENNNSVTNNTVTQEVIKEKPIKKEAIKPVVKNETKEQYSSGYENKFGRVVNDKYVGGSLIQFIKNANSEGEYEYLKNQFYQLLDTMYVTEDKITYYYLTDIISNLANKADTNILVQEDFTVKGKKIILYCFFSKRLYSKYT